MPALGKEDVISLASHVAGEGVNPDECVEMPDVWIRVDIRIREGQEIFLFAFLGVWLEQLVLFPSFLPFLACLPEEFEFMVLFVV